MIIASEEQAERIGETLTGGTRNKDFIVFWYEQRPSRLTLFGVEVKATGHRVLLAPNPNAAVSA